MPLRPARLPSDKGPRPKAWQPMLSRPRQIKGFLKQAIAMSPAAATASPASEPATVYLRQQATQAWQGQGSQHDFMLKDQCILVDGKDSVTGHASKKDVHAFTQNQPTGQLHRAFSVFLFNNENKLLLQQRAASKITFPGVWTNTCCSHQLSGFDPSEVDAPDAVKDGSVPGSKLAAVRKLGHELGIPAHQVPLQGFRYLTRLHYCAADPHSEGGSPPWGEHEMDYILFINAKVDLRPNPDEVSDTKYVTLAELKTLMEPNSGLRWSPWFRILVQNHLDHWWKDLQHTLDSVQPKEWSKIYDVTSVPTSK